MLNQINTNTPKLGSFHGGLILTAAPDLSRVRELRHEDTREVISFLSVRPVHTVVMTSFIKDNGIESSLNRGKFFAYCNANGQIEGVALIGHTTLVETRSDAALKALAFTARSTDTPIHLVMSNGDSAAKFWKYLNPVTDPRLVCTEALFEVAFPLQVKKNVEGLRLAAESELLAVAEAQAEVAFLESGADPMLRDREGFLRRVARRIEQKRVFVVFDGDKLVFKADIIADTEECIYLEGIYVGENYRGQGIGSNCLANLTVDLLCRTSNVCLLSNVGFAGAHRSYAKAGFKRTDECVTLFA